MRLCLCTERMTFQMTPATPDRRLARTSARCGVHLEAAGPVPGVWLPALVPVRQRQVQEGHERRGEGAERPLCQPGREVAANHEPHPEAAGPLPPGADTRLKTAEGNKVAVGLQCKCRCYGSTAETHWGWVEGIRVSFDSGRLTVKNLDGRVSSCPCATLKRHCVPFLFSLNKCCVPAFLHFRLFLSLLFRSLSCFTSRWAALEYFSGPTRLRRRRLRKRKVKVKGVMMVINGALKQFDCADIHIHTLFSPAALRGIKAILVKFQ